MDPDCGFHTDYNTINKISGNHVSAWTSVFTNVSSNVQGFFFFFFDASFCTKSSNWNLIISIHNA